METSDFDYYLPPGRIAQTPIEPRDSSRLMVIDKTTGKIQHTIFRDIGDYLLPGDLLVLNETRVIPARLYGKKYPTGGKVELLLLKRQTELIWEALVGGKGMVVGKKFILEEGIMGEVVECRGSSDRLLRFSQPLDLLLDKIGHVPLPPYIHTHLANPERYQTIYAQIPGSSAAPTAGLHFTQGLFQSLEGMGIQFMRIVLHIGLDTFAPVLEDDPTQHTIHSEWCRLNEEDVQRINEAKAKGHRLVAVGTTSVRTLESAATENGVQPFTGLTNLFILPGYQFKVVDAMITNFHLPRSTLIMLVSAFAGRETILNAYQVALNNNYRFYSFGDAMLLL